MIRRKRSRRAGPVVTIAALVVVGLLWIRLLVVQPKPANYQLDPSAWRQFRLARQKMGELTSTVSQLSEAARRGEARSTVLRLSRTEITAMLAEAPEVRGELEAARIQSPEVRLEKGRVITTAQMERAGTPVPITAEGELAARGGLLIYASDQVRIANVPAPEAVRATVDARIQDAFRRLEGRAHARVDRVTITRDAITLKLSSQPE